MIACAACCKADEHCCRLHTPAMHFSKRWIITVVVAFHVQKALCLLLDICLQGIRSDAAFI